MKYAVCHAAVVLTMAVSPGVCGEADGREARGRFKGVELYSWRDDENQWVFALLDGTNRLKTETEVKGDKNPIKGAAGLAKALSRLAVDEHVSWNHRIKGFEYPPEATRKEIQKAAEDAKVDLKIAAKE